MMKKARTSSGLWKFQYWAKLCLYKKRLSSVNRQVIEGVAKLMILTVNPRISPWRLIYF